MSESLVCPKCSSEMEEGFIVDHDEASRRVAQWVAGAPEKSFWVGTKLSGKRMLKIQTFRCTKCGFLESYAPE